MTATIARRHRNLPDLNELQARLSALPGNRGNQFTENVWQFINQRGKRYTVDFDTVLALSEVYPDWVRERGIDPVSLSKQIWLSLAESTTVNSYTRRLKGLRLWMVALARRNLPRLTRENSRAVLTFMLTNNWRGGRPSPLKAVRSEMDMTFLMPLQALKDATSELGLDWISRDVTEAHVRRQFKVLIPELTDNDLTYQDWKKGQSFNLLTLDHGRYYVEHCLNFFEEHAPLACALSQTLQACATIATDLGVSQTSVRAHISRVLEGRPVTEIWPSRPALGQRMQTAVVDYFLEAHRKARFEHHVLKENVLEQVAEAFGLVPSPETVDRLRVIIWDWLRREDIEETQCLLGECQRPVLWHLFLQILDAMKQRCDQSGSFVPTVAFFKSFGLDGTVYEGGKKTKGGYSLPRQFIELVASAGLVGVVALTGWRASEFGFSYSDIQRNRNMDKLDQYAFPHRYQVDWYVYKTSGRVRQLREVTFSAVAIAERLGRMHGSDGDRPCLYGTFNRKIPSQSEETVLKAVSGLWPHYVQHYAGFELIDNWESWQNLAQVEASGDLLTMDQYREKERLLVSRSADEWSELLIDGNLREAHRRSREEWPRLAFFFQRSFGDKKDWVSQYRGGTLRADWRALLDTHLSDETRDWLSSLSDVECQSGETSKTIHSEMLGEALYPSPHAFRHMWAEAIYRRFDGDAGWMIRSQFKHISRTMWLAYIRDKDNRAGHQRVKIRVINSLVHNYIKSHGEGYAGQMNKLLRRLLRQTRVQSPEQQMELAEQLANIEVENIKANPWGYCLLMRRTRYRARCAEQGEPMRHNASPELCLGCVHNLMQTTNVEWMLFQIASHVEVLNNPAVPDIFKQPSLEMVRDVTRHVRTLNARHEALPELESVLTSYKLRTA
ncbi:hypothetical protein [Marinobacter sp.]|uniref:hypothetical protein n=1 Tax=Marinobacter sp. TaxID=50741 RepID=UPI00198E3697|nr:hypothetical protein [Marinobacter sp.]MBC7193835.1 hypothetical protein [Marinobacter sp.]